MGVLFWTEFVGLLRPAEMWNLRPSSVQILREHDVLVVTIRQAKTWKFAARVQTVVLDCPVLLRAWRKIKYILCVGTPTRRVFPFSIETLERRLAAILRALGVPGVATLASFRTGGATEEWIRHRDLPGLRLLGRWGVEKTLEHYIQEATAFLQEEAFPAEGKRRIRIATAASTGVLRRWLRS